MPKRSLPDAVSDRIIACLQEHVELSRPTDAGVWLSRGLCIKAADSISWLSGFSVGRGAPSPKRYGRAVWAIVHHCAVVLPEDDHYFDWGSSWKAVDVASSPQRITATLRSKDGRTLTLSPIDISDQGL
jgi:hypothetical protein